MQGGGQMGFPRGHCHAWQTQAAPLRPRWWRRAACLPCADPGQAPPAPTGLREHVTEQQIPRVASRRRQQCSLFSGRARQRAPRPHQSVMSLGHLSVRKGELPQAQKRRRRDTVKQKPGIPSANPAVPGAYPSSTTGPVNARCRVGGWVGGAHHRTGHGEHCTATPQNTPCGARRTET